MIVFNFMFYVSFADEVACELWLQIHASDRTITMLSKIVSICFAKFNTVVDRRVVCDFQNSVILVARLYLRS